MFKLRLVAAAVLAGAFALMSSGAAQAYPLSEVQISSARLYGGDIVTFKAAISSGPVVSCKWTVTLPGAVAAGETTTRTGTGTSFSGSYRTKKVDKIEKFPIAVTCNYNDASSSVAQTARNTGLVTLLPRGAGSGGNGILPNTGGSSLYLIFLGGALVVGGGAVVYTARRRHNSGR